MARLFRFPEAAALGTHAAVMLAALGNGRLSARELAGRLDASEAHLAKVMQRLVRAGLVVSTRGPSGGFALARPADRVSLLEVYEAIEGPVEPARCVFGEPVCGRKTCLFGGMPEELDAKFRTYLANATLAELARDEENADGRPQADHHD